MKRILPALLLLVSFISPDIQSQPLTQAVKGSVVDEASEMPLVGVTVLLTGTDPLIGTVTDDKGRFRMEQVPVGRYDVQFSMIGYKPFIAREVLVVSGRETVLEIRLTESVETLQTVEIKASSNKNEPLGTMAPVSARQVNMEEAGRFAGGFDDPARLVASYAGVASSIGNNAIAIRGNSPKGLLWRMEGVRIPNPNHFADYITLGGGAVTALSSHTMGNSDFITGAFPAEYGNALSGVFDINLRTGNSDRREYAFQAGIVGIDAGAEGPFIKGKEATYLFNYRYSTLGLLAPLLPPEMGIITYQDLSFKLNFPSRSGTFTAWGIGALDYQGKEAVDDPAGWKTEEDREEYSAKLTMGALGLSYKKILGPKTVLKASASAVQNGIRWKQGRYSEQMILQPSQDVDDRSWRYGLSAQISHKFGKRHQNNTGGVYDSIWYDIRVRNADGYGDPLVTYADGRGCTGLWQFFSQSKFSFSDRLTMNAGVYAQVFALNQNFSIEPRLGLRWNFLPRHTFSLGYGLHSQAEKPELYLVEQETDQGVVRPNLNLGFNKAHHWVLGYEFMLNELTNLKVEPYLQILFDVPVVPGSYISTINLDNVWNFNDSLVNEGKGMNAGIDLTLERYLGKGFYYMVTASVFQSYYTGGDGVKRNTRYNKGYLFNVLAGKEWKTGSQKMNTIGANFRMSYMGGDYITPVDREKTLDESEIVYDYSRAYEEKLGDAPILSVSASYRRNKARYSSVWSLNIINALGYKEFQEYVYNPDTQEISKKYDLLIIPNISYKIEF